MEIALQVKDGLVCNASAWSNGCSFSKSCAEAAVLLAKGKRVEDVPKINMIMIMEEIGKLPETLLHCAQLAETTLQRAMKNYLAKDPGRSFTAENQ